MICSKRDMLPILKTLHKISQKNVHCTLKMCFFTQNGANQFVIRDLLNSTNHACVQTPHTQISDSQFLHLNCLWLEWIQGFGSQKVALRFRQPQITAKDLKKIAVIFFLQKKFQDLLLIFKFVCRRKGSKCKKNWRPNFRSSSKSSGLT